MAIKQPTPVRRQAPNILDFLATYGTERGSSYVRECVDVLTTALIDTIALAHRDAVLRKHLLRHVAGIIADAKIEEPNKKSAENLIAADESR